MALKGACLPGRENYGEVNLACLARKNPGLALKLAEIAPAPVEVISTKEEGHPTLRLENGTGRQLFLHSRFCPQEEAAQAVAILNLERARLVGIVGLGCGYYVRNILERIHPQSAVIVLEPHLSLLKASLSTCDLRDILNSPRVHLIDATAPDLKAVLQEALLPQLHLSSRLDFFATPLYQQLWPEKCRALRSQFLDTIIYISTIMGNSPGDTLQGMEQIFANFGFLLTSPSLAPAQGYFKGLPAFCVAAGPSLNKNIRWLKEAQEKGLVVCADTILERLLREGITPDVVCCLERGEIVYEYFFKDKNYPPEVVLAGQSVVWPAIFSTFPGPRVVCLKETLPLEEWVGSILAYLPLFRAGSSVGNMNFGLARYLGCDPLVLVGQDLAYGEEGESHACGTIYENQGAGLSLPPEPEEYILGKNGKMLRTRKWWKAFHHWFEIEIPQTKARCLDATEGGALIQGAEITTLREVTAACAAPKPKRLNEVLAMPAREEVLARIEKLKGSLEKQLQQVRAVQATLKEAKKALNELDADLRRARKQGGKVEAGKYMNRVQKKIEALPAQSHLFTFIVQALVARLNWTLANTLEGIRSPGELDTWRGIYGDFAEKAAGIADITAEILSGGLRTIKSIKVTEV